MSALTLTDGFLENSLRACNYSYENNSLKHLITVVTI